MQQGQLERAKKAIIEVLKTRFEIIPLDVIKEMRIYGKPFRKLQK